MIKIAKRFRWALVAAAMALGTVVPLGLTATQASAADDSFISSDYTGNLIGQAGSAIEDLYHGSQQQNLYFEGTVQSTGGQCWPFACGNGANAYFQGKNVWVIYHSGTSACMTSTYQSGEYTTSACGGGHSYSLWVQGTAFDGHGANHESWANVGATNDDAGAGEYLEDLGSASNMIITSSAPAQKVSFYTYVG